MRYRFRNRLRDQMISWLPTPKFTGARILCFHDVQDKTAFAERMSWLKNNFSVVSLDDCFTESTDEIKVAITFDDGFRSWITNAAPVLEKYNLPATFFVNSGLVGLTGTDMQNFFKINCFRKEDHLTAISLPELQALAQHSLFDIGGHTKDHFLFSEKTDKEMLRQQIVDDKVALKKMTGLAINYFAYPFGQMIHAAPAVQEMVATAGYKKAFTIVPGAASQQTNPWTINRDSLELYQSERVWSQWLHGTYDPFVKKKIKLYERLQRSYR